MRVVITGGAGFLGLRLARQLAARGRLAGAALDEILLFDQAPPPPEAGPLPSGSRLVAGDIADPAAIAALAAGPSPLTVYHLASVVSAGGELSAGCIDLRGERDGVRRRGRVVGGRRGSRWTPDTGSW